MNTNENSTQEILFCKFQNFGISQSLEIYQKFPFSNFVSKCVKCGFQKKFLENVFMTLLIY